MCGYRDQRKDRWGAQSAIIAIGISPASIRRNNYMKKFLIVLALVFVSHVVFAQDCPQTSPTYTDAQGQIITVIDNCTLSAPVKSTSPKPAAIVQPTHIVIIQDKNPSVITPAVPTNTDINSRTLKAVGGGIILLLMIIIISLT